MPAQQSLDQCYMLVAVAHSLLSKAQRSKVGACLVTKNGIIVPGYNGLASGGSNELETSVTDAYGKALRTKPEVIHAELNCLLKCAKEQVSSLGCKIYVSLSPCIVCSEMLLQAGVAEVIYLDKYRDTSGIDNLRSNGIIVRQITLEN